MNVDVMIPIMWLLLEYHVLFQQLFLFFMLVLYSKVKLSLRLFFLMNTFLAGERKEKKLSRRKIKNNLFSFFFFIIPISISLNSYRKTSSTTIYYGCSCWYKNLSMVTSKCLKINEYSFFIILFFILSFVIKRINSCHI